MRTREHELPSRRILLLREQPSLPPGRLSLSLQPTNGVSLMEMIEAVIKPQKLDAVKNALAKMGILGVTAIECKGYGRQAGHTERYRGAKHDVGFVPKILLHICVNPVDREPAIHAIVEASRTGEVGDGKIFVYPVQKVVRIRTGEVDESAI
jgi:nitrogen regulatory protein PII